MLQENEACQGQDEEKAHQASHHAPYNGPSVAGTLWGRGCYSVSLHGTGSFLSQLQLQAHAGQVLQWVEGLGSARCGVSVR